MTKYILPILLVIFTYSCQKEQIQTDGSATLQFSNDTIIFDTIFSSVGSVTKQLMVYNNNDYDITTNIRLEGNSEGNFRMNVDGESGNNIQNVKISGKDSIFVFLEVTIDPNNTNTPYLVSDSIIFTTGNKTQDVDLIAYGQDAYFHTANTYGDIINGEDTSRFFYHQLDCNEIWNNDKPHVIYGHVIVDPNCLLTINQGVDIYLHKNSGIIVGNPFSSNSGGGTIKVNGTLGNEVTFRGDRLDSWYDSLPGQWDRIWLYPGSVNNEFTYANFQNGTIAIHSDTIGNQNPTAIINNCRIDNMSAIGILGQGSKLEVNNTIITKCGQYSVVCNIGGDYSFKHCTFANYWNFDHRNTPSILLNNYYEGSDGNIYIRDLNNAYFGNCIIDGNLSTEISFQENAIGNFNYIFDHCLLKIDPNEDTETSNYINIIKNINPEFLNKQLFDFHLSAISPCNSAGDFNITQSESVLFLDLEGNLRDNVPELGSLKRIN